MTAPLADPEIRPFLDTCEFLSDMDADEDGPYPIYCGDEAVDDEDGPRCERHIGMDY